MSARKGSLAAPSCDWVLRRTTDVAVVRIDDDGVTRKGGARGYASPYFHSTPYKNDEEYVSLSVCPSVCVCLSQLVGVLSKRLNESSGFDSEASFHSS